MKKVRYALGAVGAVPALGMMIPGGAATSHAPKAGKTVSLQHKGVAPAVGCTASNRHTVNDGFIFLSYYATQHGSKTCIGDIIATGGFSNTFIDVWVSLPGGVERCRNNGVSKVTEVCDKSFTRPFSIVGFSNSAFTGRHILRHQV